MTSPKRVPFFLILTAIILPFRGAAQDDPCDFASSGAVIFPREQILACFESVPFNRGDLENILAVINQARSFSDLAEWYDARTGWVDNLAALAVEDFPNDFAMHNALIAEHKSHKTFHVEYQPPACYTDMFTAFVPFDFGATTRFARHGDDDDDDDKDSDSDGERQIVFIEDVPSPFREFYQQVTGIDTQALVGLRVVAINSAPVLDHFRAFGQEQLLVDESDGVHLNMILNQGSYSIRNLPFTSLPERDADEYLFESRSGERFSRTLPWVFVWQGVQVPAPPLTASTEEFIDLCMEPKPPFQAAEIESVEGIQGGKERALEQRLLPQRSVRRPVGSYQGFFEVPPCQLGKHIEVIIPSTDGAEVLQFRRNVTAIRLDETLSDWTGVVREGVEHACQNSERLIIDVRGASGGVDHGIHWLSRHLFPEEEDPVEAGKLLARTRNDNAKLNEIYFKSALFESMDVSAGVFPCAVGIGTQCFMDPDTGEPLPRSLLDWFLVPSFTEERGGVPVPLSRQFVHLGFLQNFFTFDFDAASCAGRFAGEDLIFLTDGVNKSGTYFLPAAFKDKGVIVTMGGFVDEPMPMGNARGGPAFDASGWANDAAGLRSWQVVSVDYEYFQFERQVESEMEMWGVYRKDRTTLHLDNPVEADLRLYVWSDSPETDGYVYGRLLKAVDSVVRRRGHRRIFRHAYKDFKRSLRDLFHIAAHRDNHANYRLNYRR